MYKYWNVLSLKHDIQLHCTLQFSASSFPVAVLLVPRDCRVFMVRSGCGTTGLPPTPGGSVVGGTFLGLFEIVARALCSWKL